jgi:hypothetical protein
MRRLASILLPLSIIFGLVLWRLEGPEPKPDNAPPSEFSAGRALHVLEANLTSGQAHPVGSAANAEVRRRIENRFHALGYETVLQRRFACNASFVCATVENVFAHAPGVAAPAVLLVAHYDSVPAGPGASDDGMGVATLLEIARAVRGERFRNDIAFLVDDGEEAGLLGAEAFVGEPAARGVRLVINVENRGTRGLSNMFETSRENRWLIRHLARALERPAATSLFYAIYDVLPNDTDVTVFKRQGIASVNFAAIGGVNWYHTPLDDVAHASLRTLQHHGDNLLAATRAFANADLDARSKTDATYFDILGFVLIWWPQEWTLWLAIGSLAALIYGARAVAPRQMTFGVLTAFGAIVLATIGGKVVSAIANARSAGMNFVATPEPSVASMWLAGAAAALTAAALFRSRADRKPMLIGIAIVWNVIGIALSLTLGGAAYLVVVPAIALSICTVAGASDTVTAAVASSVAALFFFPLGLLFYDALGSRAMAVIAVLIALFATLVAPLFAQWRNAGVLALATLVCAGVAALVPATTKEKPRRISIAYVDDVAAEAPQWVIVEALTPQLRAAAAFRPTNPALTPWDGGTYSAAPAGPHVLPRVVMEGERTSTGVRIRIRSLRNAPRLVLRLRGGKVVRVNGVAPPPPNARHRRTAGPWGFVVATGVDEMVVDVVASGAVEAVASDTTFELLPAGRALGAARDSDAVPAQDGDVAVTRARATF